jgi:hypothetical protein
LLGHNRLQRRHLAQQPIHQGPQLAWR